jgi:hypothetical protein
MPAADPQSAPSATQRGIMWVASYPKSGNTWLRVFLYHLVRLANGYEGSSDVSELARLGGGEANRIDLFERILRKPVLKAKADEIAAARPKVQAAIAEEADGIVFAKTHNALGGFLGAPTINLGVTIGAFYVIRNPLDIAPSLADHFEISIDEAIARMELDSCVASGDSRAVYEFWGSWSQNVASWTGQPHPLIMPLRYEDMLSAPRAVFAKVAEFSRQEPTGEQVAEAMRLSSFQRLRKHEDEHGFHEARRPNQKFFRQGRAGTWREALTEDQVRRVVAAHHVQMRRVGYITDDLMQYIPRGA